MKCRICSNKVYAKLRDSALTKVVDGFSQENVFFLGMFIAASQPDILSEDPKSEDICFAVWPFYLFK